MNTLDKYVWLAESIHRHGPISFDGISKLWSNSTLNDDKSPLTKRTFLYHLKAIEENFGIKVICDRKNGYQYSICEAPEIQVQALRKWMLDTLSVNMVIRESSDMASRIMIDSIPSGNYFLQEIITAMRKSVSLKIRHQSFWKKEESQRIVHPYGLRLSEHRWYLVAFSPDNGKILTFGLDRIHEIKLTDSRFTIPEDFDLNEYFVGSCGMNWGKDPLSIRIKADCNQQKYIQSLPLHESQKVIEWNDREDYAIFEYYVVPSIEFTRKLMAYGSSIEVLSPISYRNELAEAARKMVEKYTLESTKKESEP